MLYKRREDYQYHLRGVHKIGKPIECVCGLTFQSGTTRKRHCRICPIKQSWSAEKNSPKEPVGVDAKEITVDNCQTKSVCDDDKAISLEMFVNDASYDISSNLN